VVLTPKMRFKQLLYAVSSLFLCASVKAHVLLPYTKCGTMKELKTLTLVGTERWWLPQTWENWAKRPTRKPGEHQPRPASWLGS
jgi:hypothetical protein